MSSNYPDGMTARDWDHVEGPVHEEELDETHDATDREGFIECDGQLIRVVWHGGTSDVRCGECDTIIREDDAQEPDYEAMRDDRRLRDSDDARDARDDR
ncbi:MAG TPA: hypothetical protein VFH61_10485 [Thermoleophilia bacterium]|nr:hypothetical protein [Thermoleophilia bacterium]